MRHLIKSLLAPALAVATSSPRVAKIPLWTLYYPRLIEWRRNNPSECVPGITYQDRYKFFARLFDKAHLAAPIDYLEFGVYQGHSIRWWAEQNQNPQSRFVGFDSFEGLPEEANGLWTKGQFTTNGHAPAIHDPRVTFNVGWFQNTVPLFFRGFERRHRLIVNMDADLFSSTSIVLAHLGPHLINGDILIFDEFKDTVEEFRAFHDFNKIFRPELECILQQTNYARVALVIRSQRAKLCP